MEYLDIYDENGTFLGKEDRKIVHRDALWHKTVHAWLYSSDGGVFFQIRADEGTLYTTASGHLKAGETVEEAFGREIKEELGINIDYKKSKPIAVVKFTMDKPLGDGSIFKDRAFANVYACEFDQDYEKFDFDLNEVNGVVKVNAKAALELFKNGSGEIDGTIIKISKGKITIEKDKIKYSDFLVNAGETALGKYKEVLENIIEFCS